jgi:hypothetical protein
MPTRLVRVVFVLLALVVGAASAQDATVIGTIDATIDGEPVSWYQIEIATEEGPAPLSTWSNLMMTIYDVTLQGFLEPRFMVDRTLAISLSLTGGLPEGCPCTFDDFSASVLYLSGGSISGDLYASDEEGGSATVVLDVFEPIGDGAYRVEGSFDATLVYVESFAAGPDPDDTIEIAGDFVVERLPEDPLE